LRSDEVGDSTGRPRSLLRREEADDHLLPEIAFLDRRLVVSKVSREPPLHDHMVVVFVEKGFHILDVIRFYLPMMLHGFSAQ
jgi:hypothetical protein